MLCASLVPVMAACDQQQSAGRPDTALAFPRADRPAVEIDNSHFGSEEVRDDRREATTVMQLAQVQPGMTVADIGAGDGYYTVRLAFEVGTTGRVLAQDIDNAALKRLGARIEQERLDNVSIKLGTEDDPQLPANSFDRIFMVHVYHEVTEPYAFLWRLYPALRKNGQIIVVNIDSPISKGGINPHLLFCEFSQAGFRLVEFVRKPEFAGYYAQFEPSGVRPEPGDIKPCRLSDKAKTVTAA